MNGLYLITSIQALDKLHELQSLTISKFNKITNIPDGLRTKLVLSCKYESILEHINYLHSLTINDLSDIIDIIDIPNL